MICLISPFEIKKNNIKKGKNKNVFQLTLIRKIFYFKSTNWN